MLKPDQARNKAGGGSPIAHPAAAICPRCGDVHAVAFPAEATTPTLYVVRCPKCGTFMWDAAQHRAVPYPEG